MSSIGKGYIGTGLDSYYTQDFWEWDQATDTWTQKTNFAGIPRGYAVGFSIGNKGYVGTGRLEKDFWEFDPRGVSSVPEKKTETELSIFPNPTNDVVNINFSSTIPASALQLQITDVAGQRVYARAIKDVCYPYCTQVDVANLPKGIYFVQVVCGNSSSVKKLVLQ
jgi:hypothetical protein